MKHPLAACLLSALSLAGPAAAGPLPKDATPIAAGSLKSFYAGSTANWTNSTAYFAPDGTVRGIFTAKDGGRHAYDGTWRVKGNEVCMDTRGHGETGAPNTDCWKWYLGADRVYWTL